MRILISNDDGINSPGIHALVRAFEDEHDCLVVAPDSQRSACGHSITINKPLIVKEVKILGIKSKMYSVNGTPADCVKLGTEKLSKEKFDLVLTGINNGFNLGSDVIYSGTVSAAVEGAVCGVFSIAVSTDFNAEENLLLSYTNYIKKTIINLYNSYGDKNNVFNINIPKIKIEELKGIAFCRLGKVFYENSYEKGSSEEMEYIVKSRLLECNPEEDTDVKYIRDGFITVTPIHYDLTSFDLLKELLEG